MLEVVEDVDARLAGPHAREGDRLHLTPGKLEDAPVHKPLYAELARDIAHPPAHLLPGNAEVLHAERDLPGRVEVEELGARVLEDAACQGGEIPVLQVVDVPARHEDLSRSAALVEPARKPVDDPSRCSLAAAGLPAQDDALARRDRETHVFDCRGVEPLVGKRDVSKLDSAIVHSKPPIPWLAFAATRSEQQTARNASDRKSARSNRGAL